MSIPNTISITCKGCGRPQDFTTWTSLNVSLDRRRKQELLNGELTRFVCGTCGWTSEVIYPLLYHDMDATLMVWLWPTDTDLDASQLPDARNLPGYCCRIVCNRNELVEKILLAEAGFDDRVVEAFKLFLRAESAKGEHPLTGPLYFAGVRKVEAGEEQACFEHVRADGTWSVPIRLDSFKEALSSLSLKVAAASPAEGSWLRVDPDQARSLLGV